MVITHPPPRRPTPPDIITRATEKMAVGFTMDDLKVKVHGRGKVNKSRAGKVVYLTCKRNFSTLARIPQPDLEAPRLHLHDEDGLIVSKEHVVFIQGFTTQVEREAATTKLGERHRIARNEALGPYVQSLQKWRKEKKAWEHDLVVRVWN